MDNETSQPSQPKEKPVILLDLNFVPTWARQPAGKNPYEQFGGGSERRDRGERREWGGERAAGIRNARSPTTRPQNHVLPSC